jgi:hypothetical protein
MFKRFCVRENGGEEFEQARKGKGGFALVRGFGKSGRSGGVLTLAGLFIMAMALVFGFAACETDEDEGDPVASEFQGDYTGYKTGSSTSTAVTVGADSIKVGDNTLTGVSTSGGESDSGTESGASYSNSWAYVWHDGDKVGIVCASTQSYDGSSWTSRALGLGPTGAPSVATLNGLGDVDVSDVVTAGSDFDGSYSYDSE